MFTEDLSAFFNTDDFAIAATYNGATAVNVIFDRAYVETLTGIAGTNPVALVQASTVDANPKGKTLLISGTTYTIRGFEPQDDGATLLLQLEAP